MAQAAAIGERLANTPLGRFSRVARAAPSKLVLKNLEWADSLEKCGWIASFVLDVRSEEQTALTVTSAARAYVAGEICMSLEPEAENHLTNEEARAFMRANSWRFYRFPMPAATQWAIGQATNDMVAAAAAGADPQPGNFLQQGRNDHTPCDAGLLNAHMDFMMETNRDDGRENYIKAVTLMMVAFSSHGNVTPRKLRKVNNDVMADTGFNPEITVEDVRACFGKWGRKIPEADWGDVFVAFRAFAEAAGILRWEQLIDQSSFSGMTVGEMINKAISKFTTFPWALLSQLIGRDQFVAWREEARFLQRDFFLPDVDLTFAGWFAEFNL